MYNFKRAVVLLGTVSSIFAFTATPAYASSTVDAQNFQYANEESTIRPQFANEVRYRKVNVTTSTEWSDYKRVSGDLITRAQGGTISSDRTVKFTGSVNGTIAGIKLNGELQLGSETGYTLNVGPNENVYMVYRVKYRIEKGTREMYDMVTGKVYQRNTYTAKTIIKEEYSLADN